LSTGPKIIGRIAIKMNKTRCAWVNDDSLYIHYHDHEWGVPIYGDRLLFEFLVLEGMQAGLSWLTILKRRHHYQRLFDNFETKKIIKYTEPKLTQLLTNSDIIRNKLKIYSVVTNAHAFLQVKKEWGSFSNYLWNFVDGKPIKNHWKTIESVPATSHISDALSKDLKKRGFKFVGSTICYAFMQAVGMVNDHTVDCFRYKLDLT
jgi:DNA-3-methyladenine glycosylase I